VLNDDDVRIVGVLNEQGTNPVLPQGLETRRLFGRGRTCEATLQEGDHPWIGGHAVLRNRVVRRCYSPTAHPSILHI